MNKKFTSYLFSNKGYVISIMLLVLLASIFAQIVPYLQGLLADSVVLSNTQKTLLTLCIILLAVVLLDYICKYYIDIIMTNTGFKVAKDIRTDIFSQIMYKPYEFFEEVNYGNILHRTNTYVYEVGTFLAKNIGQFGIGLARFAIIFVFLFSLNFYLALILFCLYTVLCVVIYFVAKVLVKKARAFKQYELNRNALIMENLNGMETILAYNAKFKTFKNYKETSEKYGKIRASYYKLYHAFFPLIDLIACLGTLVIYLFGYYQSFDVIGIGVLVATLGYASKMLSPMQSIAAGLGSLLETSATINEVFDLTKDSVNPNDRENVSFKEVEITCENLSYDNDNNNTHFKNVNLTLPFGKKYLIFGEYGLGKTAFASLILGHYKPSGGKVLFNGKNITKISTKSISDIISVSSDYVAVFNTTILENVRFAKPEATDSEVKKAIKLSGLDRMVNKFKNGIKTNINEYSVSEGDKQLLSFARIVLKNTPVVIIDEASRDFDKNIRNIFWRKLEKFCENKTLIYINQNQDVKLTFDKVINFKDEIKK